MCNLCCICCRKMFCLERKADKNTHANKMASLPAVQVNSVEKIRQKDKVQLISTEQPKNSRNVTDQNKKHNEAINLFGEADIKMNTAQSNEAAKASPLKRGKLKPEVRITNKDYRGAKDAKIAKEKEIDHSALKMSPDNTLREVPRRMPEVLLEVETEKLDIYYTNDELL